MLPLERRPLASRGRPRQRGRGHRRDLNLPRPGRAFRLTPWQPRRQKMKVLFYLVKLFCKCIFSEDVLSISAGRAASQKELTALPQGQLSPPFPNSVEPPGLPPTARQPITLPGPGRSPNLPKS